MLIGAVAVLRLSHLYKCGMAWKGLFDKNRYLCTMATQQTVSTDDKSCKQRADFWQRPVWKGAFAPDKDGECGENGVPQQRIPWVDVARGMCMVLIILDHTESYYIDTHHVLHYDWYVANVLAAFFFLSGYLLPAPHAFTFTGKLRRIGQTLVLPYFVFTTLMAVPKALAHGHVVDLSLLLEKIITGQASWFVAALVSAEIIFLVLIKVFSRRQWCAGVVCLLLFLLPAAVKQQVEGWWMLPQALMMLPFLFAGYAFKHRPFVLKSYQTALLLVGLVLLKVFETKWQISLAIYPLFINQPLVFLLDMAAGCLFIVSVARFIGAQAFLQCVGRQALACYFLCGGIPFLLGKGIEKLGFGYEGHYERVLIVFVLNVCAIHLAASFIYRYLPWAVGRARR